MAKVVQLKDNTQDQAFPVTKERAVYTDAGVPALNKPIGTTTESFTAGDSAVWRTVVVPVSLQEGYYRVKITGVLDHEAATAQARITDARSFNMSDTIKLFFISMQIQTNEYEFSFYVNSTQASNTRYLVYTQSTQLGGVVTVDVYNADQLRWQTGVLNQMIYNPIAVGSNSRKPLESGASPVWLNCFVDVKFKPGLYVIKTHVSPQNANDVTVRLNTAHTLNTSDLVKWIFKRGTIDVDKVFYVEISEEESELITCVVLSQKTNLLSDLTLEVFPIDQLYWRTNYLTEMFEPIGSTVRVFEESDVLSWKTLYVPLTLAEGYYTVRVSGILDQSSVQTQSRIVSAKSFNITDTIKILFTNLQINSTEYTYSFYLSANEASAARYLVFTQQTMLGGEVKIDLYKYDQLGSNVDILNEIIYKPLYSGAISRQAVQEEAWCVCYAPVIIGPGRYVIKTHVGSTNTQNVMIRLNKARTINVADIVKIVFNTGTIKRDKEFYIDVTPEEAELTHYILIAQRTDTFVDLTIEMFYADQLYWDVEQLKNGTNIALPSYYYDNNYLPNLLKSVNDNSSFIHGISFPFITDLHFMANSLNSKYLLKEVLDHTACSMVVCGGDISVAYGDISDLQYCYDTLLEYAGYVGHDRWFAVVGNHDFHISESAANPVRTNWTWGKTYNGLIKPSERWQVRSEMTGGYYCVDNDVQKTRFVMLNTTEPVSGSSSAETTGSPLFNNAQLSWLVSVLQEHTNYNIIVVSHITTDPDMPSCPGYSNVQSCLEAFRNKTTYSDVGSGITADFTSTTNDLVCHINGHCHSDDSHVSNSLLTISTTCDAHYRDDGWGANVDTISEQAFDVFCIDYDARTIKTVRFGRGENRTWSY